MPTWLEALEADVVERRRLFTKGGTLVRAWVCEVAFRPWLGPTADSLAVDCRKGSGLVTGNDGSMSCAEVEVVRRLRAAGLQDAGWLATCGAATWSEYQRPRSEIRSELLALGRARADALPASGVGAPDVAALSGDRPVFVECKGSEPLQDNQRDWLRAALSRDELQDQFAIVLRRVAA